MPSGSLKNVFLVQHFHTQIRRDSTRKLHKPVVQKGETSFNGVSHRHSISLRGKDISRQQSGRFQILRLRKYVPLWIVFRKVAPHLPLGVRLREFGSHLAREEDLQL